MTHCRGSIGNARLNVTRGRAIICDQGSKICEGIDKQYFLVAYLRWQMVGGVAGDSHEFGLRLADLHPHKVGFFLKYNQSFFEHARRWSNDGDVIRVIEISELYSEATTAQQPMY